MKSRMHRWISMLLAIAMLAAMLAGCGKKGNSSAEGTVETTSSGNGVTMGEEVTMILGNDTSTLDFHVGHSGGLKYTFDTIYEPLFIMDQRGEALKPVVGKSFEHVENCKYLVEIYENVHDTDGNHITTEDIQWIYDTCKEITNYGNMLSTYDHIEIIDEYSFYLYLTTEALGGIELILTGIPTISKSCYEADPDRFVQDPVGTSGYVVTFFQEGYGYSVEFVGDWREEGQNTTLCFNKGVKKVNYIYITEAAQVRMALLNGEADVAYNVATDDLDTFREADGFTVNEDVDNRLTQAMFNCSDQAVTSDIHLRKAIAYCMNRQEINDFIFNGTAGVPEGLAGLSLIDYNNSWDYPYEYNIEAAKEELEQSNYNGETIRILTTTAAVNKSCATLMISYMNAIGVKAELLSVEDSIIESIAGEPGDWELYLSPRGSEDYMCNMWVHWADQNRFDGATQGFAVDDKLQGIYERLRDATTWSQDVSDEANDYNNEMMYNIPLFQAPSYCVYNSDMISSVVLNYKVYPIVTAFTYNY